MMQYQLKESLSMKSQLNSFKIFILIDNLLLSNGLN